MFFKKIHLFFLPNNFYSNTINRSFFVVKKPSITLVLHICPLFSGSYALRCFNPSQFTCGSSLSYNPVQQKDKLCRRGL